MAVSADSGGKPSLLRHRIFDYPDGQIASDKQKSSFHSSEAIQPPGRLTILCPCLSKSMLRRSWIKLSDLVKKIKLLFTNPYGASLYLHVTTLTLSLILTLTLQPYPKANPTPNDPNHAEPNPKP